MNSSAPSLSIRTPSPSKRSALACGLCAVALVFAYQAILVHRLGSNWTALFCAGANIEVPPPLNFEHIQQIPNSDGYDGEFYHYVAHDPFLTRGFASAVDAPRVRYQRILLPLLAYLLAAGRDRFVDRAYFAVNLAFVFLGIYWLSRYAANQARSSAWGLAFIVLPAVLVSNDRMTVDAVLAALCVGFLLYSGEGSSAPLYLCLVLAALSRETGYLLIVSYSLWLLLQRRPAAAVLFATSALPALIWYLFVWTHAPYYHVKYISLPFTGLIIRLLNPTFYRLSPGLRSVAIVCDYLALSGVMLALALSVRLAFKGARDPRALAIYLFALLAVLLADQGVWRELIAYGRAFTPLLLFLATVGFEDRRVASGMLFALPLTIVTLPLLGARAVFLLHLAPSMIRP